MTGEWIDLCATSDVDVEDVLDVDVAGHRAALVHTADGAWCAIQATCTHGRSLLADGFVIGAVIECPKHNGRFDARTGVAVRVPASEPLQTFPTRVLDGRVQAQFD
jgi:MocE subfamily Rieske [2Fe-2S] domain protein